jgi:hypothetical protein
MNEDGRKKKQLDLQSRNQAAAVEEEPKVRPRLDACARRLDLA